MNLTSNFLGGKINAVNLENRRLDYLRDIQPSYKWQIQKKNIRPGIMVVLKDDNPPKCRWVLGLIIVAIYGQDGLVRAATVQTAHGLLK